MRLTRTGRVIVRQGPEWDQPPAADVATVPAVSCTVDSDP